MPPAMVAGTVAISDCVLPVVNATGLLAGVVIANASPAAGVTKISLLLLVQVLFTDGSGVHVPSIHSAVSTTVPAAVGVKVSGGVTPDTSVVRVVAERVAAPVLVAPIEKRMVTFDRPSPAAVVAAAVAVIVPAPTWIVVLGATAKATVEPLISIGILADCPATVAVTVAVRLKNSARPLLNSTIACPFASVVAELAFRLPVVVAKETGIPGITALDESTKVAVSVAAVALSVRIKFADVPSASPAGAVGVGVTVVVVVPALGTLSPQLASVAAKRSDARILVNDILKQ